MKLHVYHCSRADITDREKHHGRGFYDRPKDLGHFRFPEEPNQADVRFRLSLGEGYEDLSQVLAEFHSIPIWTNGSPSTNAVRVQVDVPLLARKLGISEEKVNKLLADARHMGLLGDLTLDYEYERWMSVARSKGCLVVMACVEHKDSYRHQTVIEQVAKEIVAIRNALIREGYDKLENVFIVPNAHLTPKDDLELDSKTTVGTLQALANTLSSQGLKVSVNSFGYAKTLHLVIHAHKLGYLYRSF